MGIIISQFFARFRKPKQVRTLLIGLDGAGKTTILYKLKFGDIINAIPTIGFNVEKLVYKNINFNIWDIGGQDKIRSLWRHYFRNTQALIFVIDSNDRLRINIVKQELYSLLADNQLRNSILLIFANKQDFPNSMTAEEIIDILELKKLQRFWCIQGSCATEGYGLFEGFDWLTEKILQK